MAEVPINVGDVEEYNFRMLYDEVLNFFLNSYNIPDEKISEALTAIKISFHYNKGNKYSDVDYRLPENLCAVLFRYAPHGARLARYKILEAMDQYPELRRILSIPHLKVVSLGGGPGSDAIGFCSAMKRWNFGGTLDICVMDSVAEWLPYINKIREAMMQGVINPSGNGFISRFGESSDLFFRGKATLSFYPCTLGEQRPVQQPIQYPGQVPVQYPGQVPVQQPEPFNWINQCDIVLICKLLSIMEQLSRANLVQVSIFISLIDFTLNIVKLRLL